MKSKLPVLIILVIFVAYATPTLLKLKALKKSLLFGGKVAASCVNCSPNYGRYAGAYNYGSGLGTGVQAYVRPRPVYSSGYGGYSGNGGYGGYSGYGGYGGYSGYGGQRYGSYGPNYYAYNRNGRYNDYGGYGYNSNAGSYGYGAGKQYYGTGYSGGGSLKVGYDLGSLNSGTSYGGTTFSTANGGVNFGAAPC